MELIAISIHGDGPKRNGEGIIFHICNMDKEMVKIQSLIGANNQHNISFVQVSLLLVSLILL